jgi:hypothetical protein
MTFPSISSTLRPYFDDLEARIDPDQEERLLSEWIDFSDGKCSTPLFSPRRDQPRPPGIDWPRVSVNAALDDYDAMALQQFGQVSRALAEGGGLLLNVRCNYGSSILPSLFGLADFIMDEALDTLPTSRPLNDLEAVRRLVEAGDPDLRGGWGEQVFAMGERFAAIARAYPKIGRYVAIYHPDCQGPLDVCEVVWGSALFYALYDHPELVHALLRLVTETYTRFLRAWAAIVPFRPGGNIHWGFYHRGSIMLRDDSATNLSPAMYAEYGRLYDQRLLEDFGGGAVHFCGRGDHLIAGLAGLRGLHAIALSQPELNDMEKIYSHTVDRGINLLGLPRQAAEAALAGGRNLRGRVHC